MLGITPVIENLEDRMQKLFIGNIPHAASEVELRKWVESHGFWVQAAEVIYDRSTGKPRGFGFVNLSEDTDLQRAISTLNGQRMDGRVLTVNKATPLTPRTEQGDSSRSRLTSARK
jgi:RNA recognition motif-containing protein